jgi:glycosyltransferase involved in cell wall biosynthesis
MTTLAFRSHPAVYPGHIGTATAPLPRRETLAIVSTRSKLCGIAAYTAALRRQLSEAFDVTVFDLDQYLLRSTHRRVRRLADRHVKDICCALAGFDAVNLQLEHGTLGRDARDIDRRFGWLVAAAPRLSVTFHTLPPPPGFDGTAFAKALVTLKWRAAFRMHADFRRSRRLAYGITGRLRRAQRWKQVSAIVHNHRDLCDVKYLYGIREVFDHPLAFLGSAEAGQVRVRASRQALPILDPLPADAVLIGVFGFLNEYKGFGTAIQALHHLPENHHLLIFGGIHPNEIAAHRPIHPYISSLFNNAYVETTLYDRISTPNADSAPALVLSADQGLGELLGTHPRDLSARIHFMGALGDAAFLTGMALCDAVVFPYLEVGQSSSGPISQALELGCRIVASRTHTFLEFAEYHKEAIEFFDIGNHLELAERILARPQFSAPRKFPEFNVETNKATYLFANSRRPARADASSPAALTSGRNGRDG